MLCKRRANSHVIYDRSVLFQFLHRISLSLNYMGVPVYNTYIIRSLFLIYLYAFFPLFTYYFFRSRSRYDIICYVIYINETAGLLALTPAEQFSFCFWFSSILNDVSLIYNIRIHNIIFWL